MRCPHGGTSRCQHHWLWLCNGSRWYPKNDLNKDLVPWLLCFKVTRPYKASLYLLGNWNMLNCLNSLACDMEDQVFSSIAATTRQCFKLWYVLHASAGLWWSPSPNGPLHGPNRRLVILMKLIQKCTVTTFKYVEGGPDREAPEVVWNTSSYI
jgi:hypothetical protein